MLAQKDLEAQWAKKNGEVHYGYKDHVLVDVDSKLITDWRVSGAALHDRQMLTALVGRRVCELWADSAYINVEIRMWFAENYPGIKLHISEKGYRNAPITQPNAWRLLLLYS